MLHEALQSFCRRNEGQLPATLSALYPDYVANPSMLVCPLGEASGSFQSGEDFHKNFENDGLTTYSYEFSSQRVESWLPPKKHLGTMNEYKHLQMKTNLGSLIPMIRCFRHGEHFHEPERKSVNLAYDGRVFFAHRYWESTTKEIYPHVYLMPGQIFKDTRPFSERVASRPTKASKEMLNLGYHYNAMLEDSWGSGLEHKTLGAFVSALKSREWVWETSLSSGREIAFDARGIIQLDGRVAKKSEKGFSVPMYAESARGIAVNQRASAVHLFGGVLFPEANDTLVATVRLHLRGGGTEDLPVRYGRDVALWMASPADDAIKAQVAWQGVAGKKDRDQSDRRLYVMTLPMAKEAHVESIEFLSAMSLSPPFVLGMTVSR